MRTGDKESEGAMKDDLHKQVNEATEAFYDSKPIYNRVDFEQILSEIDRYKKGIRADEREKVLSEVEEEVKKAKEMFTNDRTRNQRLQFLAWRMACDEVLVKLNQLKERE